MLTFKYKGNEMIPQLKAESDIPYLSFPILQQTGIVTHGFSTRLGGVSQEHLESLNLSFSRGDKDTYVRENFSRIAHAIGFQTSDMVFSMQTHTTNVQVVTEAERGRGFTRPLDCQDIDGMVTNVPGIVLATFYADCVPLYFVDPVKKVIGLSHSGWRGTVGRIGQETVRVMEEEYGCLAEDIIAAVGPSICQECYEVSEEVIREFKENFAESDWESLFYQKEDGKYQLDLWKANEVILRNAGLLTEHICVTNVCTCCNHELLYSHRASHGMRGNLGAFMCLK